MTVQNTSTVKDRKMDCTIVLRLEEDFRQPYLWQCSVQLKNLSFSLHLAHTYLTGQVHSAGTEPLQGKATVEVPLWAAPHLLKGKLLQRGEEGRGVYSAVKRSTWKWLSSFSKVVCVCVWPSSPGTWLVVCSSTTCGGHRGWKVSGCGCCL